tara:strand:- start:91 stop:1101 length:1011 start_codon:yes stop_codon:yes gene_type:complete
MFLRCCTYIILILLQCCAYQGSNSNLTANRDLYTQIEELSESITHKLDKNSIKKIAVMNFTSTSNPNLGLYISDEITLQLFLKEKFKIIERDQLDYVIEEQKLSSSGLIDDTSIINIGNILSADAIITGDISILNDIISINTKVISSSSGEILFIDRIHTSDISELINSLSDSKESNSTNIDDSFSNYNSQNADKSINRLSRKILTCLTNKDYNCFKQFIGSKDDLRKIFLIKHRKDKALRKTKIKNLSSEYKQYKKAYKNDFIKTIKRLDSRKINWEKLKIKKVDYKIIKNYDQKKLFKVDLILSDKKNRIHIGFNTFKMNGKWIVNNIDVKRNK